MPHDWFAKLTGFREESYELTRSRLAIEGDELVSTVNGKRYGIGSLSVPTLAELRCASRFPRVDAVPCGASPGMRGRCTPIRNSKARCFRSPRSSICWR